MYVYYDDDENTLHITYNWMLWDASFVSLYGESYENW